MPDLWFLECRTFYLQMSNEQGTRIGILRQKGLKIQSVIRYPDGNFFSCVSVITCSVFNFYILFSLSLNQSLFALTSHGHGCSDRLRRLVHPGLLTVLFNLYISKICCFLRSVSLVWYVMYVRGSPPEETHFSPFFLMLKTKLFTLHSNPINLGAKITV